MVSLTQFSDRAVHLYTDVFFINIEGVMRATLMCAIRMA